MKIESMVTITGAEYEALRAEVERLKEELDIWESVFPDIAPERVLPDRSLLEAEVERLRAALAQDKPRAAWADLCVKNQMLCEEIERLRAALEAWMDAVMIDATMEGPRYIGVSSTLGRKAWEKTSALTQEPRT